MFITVAPQYIQRNLQTEFENIANGKKIRILFCIIPDNSKLYAQIKQHAEYKIRGENGVLTQCIKAKTVLNKGNDQSTISNIILKVNAKLNGTNHKLENSTIIDGTRCMIVGADVTHPSPDQTTIPRYLSNIHTK